jgi:hypothetical protein
MGGRFNCMELPEPDFYSKIADLQAQVDAYPDLSTSLAYDDA